MRSIAALAWLALPNPVALLTARIAVPTCLDRTGPCPTNL